MNRCLTDPYRMRRLCPISCLVEPCVSRGTILVSSQGPAAGIGSCCSTPVSGLFARWTSLTWLVQMQQGACITPHDLVHHRQQQKYSKQLAVASTAASPDEHKPAHQRARRPCF